MRHFKGKDQFFAVGDDHMHPIYFINATFFKTEEIRAHNLEIDSKLRPNFEDGKFIAEYLLNAPGGLVGYLAKPKYYYRKRADGTSVIDNSFESAEKYTTVLSRGYLAVLREAQEKRGYVPSNLQQTVIRDLSWYFKRLINRQERCEQLEHDGVREFFLDALDDIFSHISISELFATNSSFLHFKVKLGIAQTFMKEAPPFWMCKIVKVDLERRELLIETYTDRMQFFFDGYPATPKEVKRATSTFCDLDFCSQYRVWLSIPEDASIFSFRVPDGTLTKLLAGKKMYERNLTLKDLARYLDKYWADYQQVGDTWLIMDRDNQADDNGEHFYRFMAEHHPEQDILFALESTSPDWERLEREGFNLVDFGTSEFEEALRSCTKIISSHANHYLLSYFGDDYIRSKKFVFLQHGIVSNDLSRWLNTFDPDLMLTTTPDERASIVSADSPYVYTEKQVKLTGLPRHDTLIKKRFEHQASGKRSTILIMPTWRRYLVDLEKDRQNGGPSNPEFPSSEYAQTWQSLLNSPELKELADTLV